MNSSILQQALSIGLVMLLAMPAANARVSATDTAVTLGGSVAAGATSAAIVGGAIAGEAVVGVAALRGLVAVASLAGGVGAAFGLSALAIGLGFAMENGPLPPAMELLFGASMALTIPTAVTGVVYGTYQVTQAFLGAAGVMTLPAWGAVALGATALAATSYGLARQYQMFREWDREDENRALAGVERNLDQIARNPEGIGCLH